MSALPFRPEAAAHLVAEAAACGKPVPREGAAVDVLGRPERVTAAVLQRAAAILAARSEPINPPTKGRS